MKRLWFSVLLLAAPACDAGGPTEPEGTTVQLTLVNPADIERPESLRLAVVWRTGESLPPTWITTFDHGLSDTEQGHRVSVEPPKDMPLSGALAPLSIVLQSPDSTSDGWPAVCAELSDQSWPGASPAWVVYQDLNQNEHLDVEDADRIWGVTDFGDQHLAVFADYEQALSEVSLEASECLRQATGGGFSPFVSGQLSGAYFYASPTPATEFTLPLNPTGYPGRFLRCGASSVSTSEESPTILSVASDVLPDVCTNDPTSCSRVEYDSDWEGQTQAFSIPGDYRWTGCVTTGALEVLWILDEQLECEGCSCVQHRQDRGWVVSADARPADWPCGDTVPICATTQVLTETIPDECVAW